MIVTNKGKKFNVSDPSKKDKPITTKHKGKAFDNLTAKERDELLKASLMRLGMLDAAENIK